MLIVLILRNRMDKDIVQCSLVTDKNLPMLKKSCGEISMRETGWTPICYRRRFLRRFFPSM